MDTTTQRQYAETFHGLHKKRDPLILFNAWDVGTAEAIAKASPAVATSSAAVASALGYADGENVPLDMVTGLKLTPKQVRFVQEYLIDLNAAQAAIRAGYSAKTARVIGHENLTKPRTIREMQRPPGSASASRRAATFTPSPKMSSLSTMMSPRLIPIRNLIRWSISVATSACSSPSIG